jgi:hypothetical protein
VFELCGRKSLALCIFTAAYAANASTNVKGDAKILKDFFAVTHELLFMLSIMLLVTLCALFWKNRLLIWGLGVQTQIVLLCLKKRGRASGRARERGRHTCDKDAFIVMKLALVL